MALLITPEGLPVGYEVFPGNQAEGQTLLVALAGLQERYPAIAFTIVADAAMINKNNEKELQERKIPYILGARIKNLPKVLEKQVLDSSGYRPWGLTEGSDNIGRYRCIKDQEVAERQLIATYSPKRARKVSLPVIYSPKSNG